MPVFPTPDGTQVILTRKLVFAPLPTLVANVHWGIFVLLELVTQSLVLVVFIAILEVINTRDFISFKVDNLVLLNL